MKIYSLFVFLISASAPLLSASEALRVSLEAPESNDERALVWDQTDKKSHFHVLVTNVSDEVQRILLDSNSWGWDNLRLEFTDSSGKTFTVHRATSHVWAGNAPGWWTLAPHETHVFDVYYNDSTEWEGFPPTSITGGAFVIRASYGVDASSLPPDERKTGWTGHVASEPVKVRLVVLHPPA